jgi:flavin reductase (DIM6/NTAB) family NADH-FMN oxidoreductase RutF
VPISADDFKAGMALRAGGVAIVTAAAGDRVHGMTVTDFSGVSVDPPLVLVCADKASNTLPLIREGGCFAINLLAEGQDGLSNKFASKKQEWERFDGLDCTTGKTGAPLIPGAYASFDCELEAEHDAGDHVIVVGRVVHLERHEARPLLYYAGHYRGLADA